jgi:hypothetical protein
MNDREFWCKAFLAAMGPAYSDEPRRGDSHDELSAYCRGAADAALEEARDAGMVTGERATDHASEIDALRANNVDASEAAERDLLRAAEALDRGQATGPELERVEFTAERDGDTWTLSIPDVGRFLVTEGAELISRAGVAVIHVKWGESMPPQPVEVWIERPKGGA